MKSLNLDLYVLTVRNMGAQLSKQRRRAQDSSDGRGKKGSGATTNAEHHLSSRSSNASLPQGERGAKRVHNTQPSTSHPDVSSSSTAVNSKSQRGLQSEDAEDVSLMHILFLYIPPSRLVEGNNADFALSFLPPLSTRYRTTRQSCLNPPPYLAR